MGHLTCLYFSLFFQTYSSSQHQVPYIIRNRRTWSFSLANLKSQFSLCFLYELTNFQNFKKNASNNWVIFLLCTQTETPEVWIFFFKKLYLCVLHFQIKLSTYNIPKASYSHLLQYCYKRFSVKNRSIYFTNNIDVSKKTFRELRKWKPCYIITKYSKKLTFFPEKKYFQSEYEQQTQTVQQVEKKENKQCKWFTNYTQNGWRIYRVWQKKIVQMIFMNYISIIYIIKQPNGSIRWLHSVSESILPGHRLTTRIPVLYPICTAFYPCFWFILWQSAPSCVFLGFFRECSHANVLFCVCFHACTTRFTFTLPLLKSPYNKKKSLLESLFLGVFTIRFRSDSKEWFIHSKLFS